MNLASPVVNTRDIGEEVYYDAVLNVNRVTPRDSDVPFIEIGIVVRAADGSVLIPMTWPEPHDVDRYDDGSDGRVDVEAWYVSVASRNDLMPGDAFLLTGMTTAYEGATVMILMEGEQIGSIVLPTNFP